MPTTFPGAPPNPLGLKVELLLAGTWTDITLYCQRRNSVKITSFGRPDWSSTMQAGELTVTLKNVDGRFSPKNTSGAYYPNITRNTQIRVSVNSQSATAVAYNGFRFWGEVYAWPPKWDPSQRDVYCSITAAGIWRRLSQQQNTLGSAYRRYYINLTGSDIPLVYWPMEDGTGSTQIIPYIPQTASNGTWTGTPSLAANTDFKGSDGIITLNAAVLTFNTPGTGTSTDNVTRFLLSVPAKGDGGSGSTSWNVTEIDSAGTVAKFETYLNPAGTVTVNLRNSGGTIVASGTTTTNVQGKPVLCSCELTPSGSNVAWAFRIITPGAAGITESLTGTVTAASVGKVSKVLINRAAQLMDTSIGHLAVSYGSVPSMVAQANALNGYIGEFAMDRFTRICAEVGIATETIGTNSTTTTMGPQLDDTLVSILQACEDTDCGLLYETRDQFGLGFRANASMISQTSALSLNYAAAVVDQDLTPTYDDQLTKNNVTVTNWDGYAQQAILTVGAMSILNPPSGIGNGYNYTRSVSCSSDTQVGPIATFLLGLGTTDEIRLPVITVKMIRASAAALYSSLPSLRPGDYFQVTNPPSFLTGTTIKQLFWGLTETLDCKEEWTISLSTVPEVPWETGFSPGTVQLAQIPGGGATTSTAPGAGGLGGLIANGSITPSMLNNGITVHTLGGAAITVASVAPSSPNTNDIWINSGTGLISQWNGSSWAPVKFDASQTVQAATIITANIAASAITSSLIAAGTVVAGIVDATTVSAASYVATGTQGQFLAYSGTPASGNMVVAVSGYAGTDSFSNSFAQGIEIKSGGLILDNQASGPSAVSGASQFYSSTAGRPRYLSQTGNDSVLERSIVNVAGFTIGNTTTATTISAATTYNANEGTQSSEYEIEIIGTLTWSSGTLNSPIFQLFVDGSAIGGGTVTQFTVGVSGQTASNVTGYRLCFGLAILTATTAAAWSSGVLWDQSANRIPGNSVAGGAVSSSVSYTNTASHTLQVYAWWAATATGQAMNTIRTRVIRRM